MSSETEITELSFEDALRELDEVVSALEAGKIPLEDMLQLSRRGTALADYCEQKLSQVEATLETLVTNSSGELVTESVEWDDEEDDEDDQSA
jgi:exodeoxyribonuclease VII small subunit